jgi:hypothetical protein
MLSLTFRHVPPSKAQRGWSAAFPGDCVDRSGRNALCCSPQTVAPWLAGASSATGQSVLGGRLKRRAYRAAEFFPTVRLS